MAKREHDQEASVKEQKLLFLSIEDCAYSYAEVVDTLKLVLKRKGLEPTIEFVPAAKMVDAAKQRTPTLIIAGHRPFPFHPSQDQLYGGEVVKALKADPETRHIPVLLLEGWRIFFLNY